MLEMAPKDIALAAFAGMLATTESMDGWQKAGGRLLEVHMLVNVLNGISPWENSRPA